MSGAQFVPSCGNCVYCWDEEVKGIHTGRMACRRYPPTTVIKEGFAPQFSHPPVPRGHFCGEWRLGIDV